MTEAAKGQETVAAAPGRLVSCAVGTAALDAATLRKHGRLTRQDEWAPPGGLSCAAPHTWCAPRRPRRCLGCRRFKLPFVSCARAAVELSALDCRFHAGHCAQLREARLPLALPARGHAAAHAGGRDRAGARACAACGAGLQCHLRSLCAPVSFAQLTGRCGQRERARCMRVCVGGCVPVLDVNLCARSWSWATW